MREREKEMRSKRERERKREEATERKRGEATEREREWQSCYNDEYPLAMLSLCGGGSPMVVRDIQEGFFISQSASLLLPFLLVIQIT